MQKYWVFCSTNICIYGSAKKSDEGKKSKGDKQTLADMISYLKYIRRFAFVKLFEKWQMKL